MVSLYKLTRCFVLACVFVILCLSDGVVFAEGVTLEEYGEGDKQFEIYEIGDKMVVYHHQRMLGDAIVEKDYIVYQFDRATGELLDRKSHWRTDLPENLPDITVDYNHLRMIVEHEIQSFRLLIISPESDVFPLDPCPKNPCWVVRGIDNGHLVITIIDAVSGQYLGRGIPPPFEAYSLSGPTDWHPCSDGSLWGFESWANNARDWFMAMEYSTTCDKWPEKPTIRGFVQSHEVALFYELAHGGSDHFDAGCDGGFADRTYASDIEDWISGYEKMPFAFIGSCEGLCNTGDGTFAYEFTKGSLENTAVVGYCGMSDNDCFICWMSSLQWQNVLFGNLASGSSVKEAFDQANANYPTCLENSCMRFYGDESFAIVPKIHREWGPCIIFPIDLHFKVVRAEDSCSRVEQFYVVNTDPEPITGNVTESCDQFSIISGGGGFSLASGETLFVWVLYAPSVPDTHYCTIDIGVSGCSDVNCTGVANNECVFPQHLDFGAIALGDSVDLDFTMYNVGCDTLFGIVSGSSPHYRILSGFGSYAIPADDSLVVTVLYKPLLIGGPWYFTVQTGALCANVSCEGISYEPPPPPCLIEPDTLDFGDVYVGESEIMTFDITNTGYGTLIDTVRSTCPGFSVMSDGAYSLRHNQTQTVSIFFNPDTAGFYECMIETGDDACTDLYCMGYGYGTGMTTGLGIVDAKRFHLYQNYPNPFNPVTNITFTVPGRSHTNLSIYDIEGRLLKTLMSGEFEGGVKTIVWNGTDGRGNPVSSGVYFYRLRAGSDVMTKKMVLLK